MSSIMIKCPHCNEYIIIYKKDFNCKIFRHGMYIDNQKQIDPHMCKEECDRLVIEKKNIRMFQTVPISRKRE